MSAFPEDMFAHEYTHDRSKQTVMLRLPLSAATGVVFGIIPAFKVAILHPIEALS